MCSIDLKPCELSVETERRARKHHRCSCCRGTIAPGQRYLIHFSLQDGHPVSEKMCEPCKVIRGEFANAHADGYGATTPTPSYLPTMLRE